MDRKSEIFVYRWVQPHHHIVLFTLSLISAMIFGYVISVTIENVNPLFPYISDTGSMPPASCVFGLLLNCGGFFVFSCMLIQHRHFEKYSGVNARKIHIVNDICMLIGSVATFGVLLVANFQEAAQLTTHLIGACLTFTFGILYCAIQSYLTFASLHGSSTRLRFYVRCVLTVIAAIAFATMFAGPVSEKNSQASMNVTVPITQWTPDTPGYVAHLASTFSEWIMVISFMMFFWTFYKDFKALKMNMKIERAVLSGETEPIIDSLYSSNSTMIGADSANVE